MRAAETGDSGVTGAAEAGDHVAIRPAEADDFAAILALNAARVHDTSPLDEVALGDLHGQADDHAAGARLGVRSPGRRRRARAGRRARRRGVPPRAP